jgi:type II secretory pathway pseudopilin PulG
MLTLFKASPARPARAFTLVEVLMGVLILSLALLGLAAVFPVVAREQRLARESISGSSAMNSVDSFIRTSDIFRRPAEAGKRFGWDLLLDNSTWSDESKEDSNSDKLGVRIYTPWVGPAYNTDGSCEYTVNSDKVVMPLAQRLWPQRVSNEDSPLFVWDLVARRVSGGDISTRDDDASVQVVTFLRRVDASIRVPAGSTLRKELETGNAAAIAVDSNTGVPRLDGRGAYARIGVVKVSAKKIDPTKNPVSWVVLKLADPGSLGWTGIVDGYKDVLPLAMQAGQKLVDPFGTVYTVTRAGPLDAKFDTAANASLQYEPKAFEVIISPGLTPAAVQALADGRLNLIFSPQIPVDVLVREYRR